MPRFKEDIKWNRYKLDNISSMLYLCPPPSLRASRLCSCHYSGPQTTVQDFLFIPHDNGVCPRGVSRFNSHCSGGIQEVCLSLIAKWGYPTGVPKSNCLTRAPKPHSSFSCAAPIQTLHSSGCLANSAPSFASLTTPGSGHSRTLGLPVQAQSQSGHAVDMRAPVQLLSFLLF